MEQPTKMAEKSNTLADLQVEVKKFNDDRDWSTDSFKDLLLNIVEEVGEARNIIKWAPDSQSRSLINKQKHEWEDFIGQLQFLVLKLAHLSDVDTENAFKNTMQEFNERFPIDKVKGKSANILAGGHDGKYMSDK